MDEHAHCRSGGHDHGPGGYRHLERRKLLWSLAVTLVVMAAEVAGGILVHSLALVSDAGHMFTHVFALGIALVAIVAANRSPCHHRTFGLVRAEILAAFVNAIFLLLAALAIIYEAVLRFLHPEPILTLPMLAVALLGLLANVISILILHGSDRRDMNIRGVVFHMLADAISSVAIVAGAVVIHFTGWVAIDPVLSVGISLLILAWGWGLLRDSGRILLQEAPAGIDSEKVAREILRAFPEVEEIDAGRLWALTVDRLIYTAHVTLAEGAAPDLLDRIAAHLHDRFNVVETTLQERRR
ncbi:cation transporter [Dissulfurirhabdus thermomarina]|uniref:Cation transporter n=1 Tax=Dissulfurirhabdus thermomarina TaxID=1765737 RepID=A0A6N9TNX5_DISTH|nr:cation diffusion facilitator family transporter [Dissulfurirhabdus thermomarina]NDY41454.1 cation transporter [Dissulfurirhabdus thermomarina]NMX24264.1 cation transporter [Dissulfurirhabdus thermomarina]